jgi:long-subunit acyl-CoA synthetase (AMP-forming)
VTPVPIESALLANPLLEQVCVMGSGLPSPVAVVVLSEAAGNLPRPTIVARLTATLESTNSRLESHERLSNLVVVKDEWTTENGLLTPTLKLKRAELEDRYRDLIGTEFSDRIVWEEV